MRLPSDALPFLRELAANNKREWFNEHKTRYQQLHSELLDFTDELIGALIPYDPLLIGVEPKNCLFRIYKDARYARDGAPYKTHFGIHVVSSGKRSDFNRAGFYLHIAPDSSMIGGGAHAPSPEWLKQIRLHILHNGAELMRVIEDETFTQYFGRLHGDRLVRPQQGFTGERAASPSIEWIKFKALWVQRNLSDAQMRSTKLEQTVLETYLAYQPLQRFLNEARAV